MISPADQFRQFIPECVWQTGFILEMTFFFDSSSKPVCPRGRLTMTRSDRVSSGAARQRQLQKPAGSTVMGFQNIMSESDDSIFEIEQNPTLGQIVRRRRTSPVIMDNMPA
jgi:hypothetical protein